MDNVEKINRSTEIEREWNFPCMPPSELELIRHQLSLSCDKISSFNSRIKSLIYASGC